MSRHLGSDAGRPRLRVAFVLAPRFTLSAFAAFVDALRIANGDGASLRSCAWAVVGDPRSAIRSNCGVELVPTDAPRFPASYDYVVVVGGSARDRHALPAAQRAFVRGAAAHDVPLVAVCAGASVLADLELTHGPGLSCVETSVAPLVAELVARHCGPSPARDPVVARAMHWIDRTLADGRHLSDLGASLGISVRQLQRRFFAELGMTLRAYRAQRRLQRSKSMLETTALPVGEIGLECGFADGAHFSRTFRRAYRDAPSRVRSRGGTISQEYGADAHS